MRTLPLLAIFVLAALWLAPATVAQSTVHYSTGFEPEEGFNPKFELIGQLGWTGEGTGGNGLLVEAFPGMGQQGFIGYYPLLDENAFTSIWHPAGLASPIPTNRIAQFDVVMRILGSTNGKKDDFRWSAYNLAGARLFSLDFATTTSEISYILDDGQIVFTGFTFDTSGTYDLQIQFNFARNKWTATLNDFVIANSLPITTKGSALNLGDVDAVWGVADPKAPGDNYMVFDNYRISSMVSQTIPPRIEAVGPDATGAFIFDVHGEDGISYDVEVTTDFQKWYFLATVVAPSGGTFRFKDTTAPGQPRSFYSVQQTNP